MMLQPSRVSERANERAETDACGKLDQLTNFPQKAPQHNVREILAKWDSASSLLACCVNVFEC